MKRYVLIFLFLTAGLISSAQVDSAQVVDNSAATQSSESLLAEAETAYESGDYNRAIVLYGRVLDSDKHSATLYYNLGNAYFRADMLGQAIVNYSRALRLDPSMEDAQHNLDVAQSRTIDKIDAVPEFFAITYLGSVRKMLGGDTWAILSIIFLAVSLSGILLWLLSVRLSLRKLGFTIGVVGVLFAISAFVCSVRWWDEVNNSSRAVVLNSAAPVQSSPAAGAKDLFVLHEGTLVDLSDRSGEWSEVVIASGEKGWIKSSSIEVI